MENNVFHSGLEADKLLVQLYERLKAQAAADLKMEAENTQATLDYLKAANKDLYKQNEELRALREVNEKEINDLNTTLDALTSSSYGAPYKLRAVVYLPYAVETRKVCCPCCGGSGKIPLNALFPDATPLTYKGYTYDNDVAAVCPACKNETYFWTSKPERKIKSEEFLMYAPQRASINYIKVETSWDDKTNSLRKEIHYVVTTTDGSHIGTDKVYKTKEEANAACEKMNIEAFNKAAEQTGNKKATTIEYIYEHSQKIR